MLIHPRWFLPTVDHTTGVFKEGINQSVLHQFITSFILSLSLAEQSKTIFNLLNKLKLG